MYCFKKKTELDVETLQNTETNVEMGKPSITSVQESKGKGTGVKGNLNNVLPR